MFQMGALWNAGNAGRIVHATLGGMMIEPKKVAIDLLDDTLADLQESCPGMDRKTQALMELCEEFYGAELPRGN